MQVKPITIERRSIEMPMACKQFNTHLISSMRSVSCRPVAHNVRLQLIMLLINAIFELTQHTFIIQSWLERSARSMSGHVLLIYRQCSSDFYLYLYPSRFLCVCLSLSLLPWRCFEHHLLIDYTTHMCIQGFTTLETIDSNDSIFCFCHHRRRLLMLWSIARVHRVCLH